MNSKLLEMYKLSKTGFEVEVVEELGALRAPVQEEVGERVPHPLSMLLYLLVSQPYVVLISFLFKRRNLSYQA
jgi:hypothetical protein